MVDHLARRGGFWRFVRRVPKEHAALDPREPFVVTPVVVLDPLPVVVGHEVDVAARLGVRLG